MSGEKEYQPDGLLGSHPWVEYELRRIQKNLPTWPEAVDLKMLYPRADRELVLAIESKSHLTARQKTYLRHWALAYLEYCRRSKQLPEEDQSRLAFLERMGLKGRSPFVIQQADRAVRLLRKTITRTPHPTGKSCEDGRGRKEIRDGHEDREVWTRVLERVG